MPNWFQIVLQTQLLNLSFRTYIHIHVCVVSYHFLSLDVVISVQISSHILILLDIFATKIRLTSLPTFYLLCSLFCFLEVLVKLMNITSYWKENRSLLFKLKKKPHLSQAILNSMDPNIVTIKYVWSSGLRKQYCKTLAQKNEN